MSCPARRYPLKRPDGHQPPVPRWHLRFDEDVDRACVAYIGLQLHGRGVGEQTEPKLEENLYEAVNTLGDLMLDTTKDAVFEEFESMAWNEEDIRHVFVWYWNSSAEYERFLSKIDLRKLHDSLPEVIRPQVGIWLEAFSVPPSRLETNYSGLDYLPGFARLPRSRTEEHTLTAYWGAARDRLSDSGNDSFDEPGDAEAKLRDEDGDGKHLVGTNTDNTVHIRTGQYWQNCPEEEVHSYENNLEPTLRSGLSYLRSTPSSGASGLRYIRNLPPGRPSPDKKLQGPLRETCVTGYFTSLGALEGWAKSHKSHLAIYNGAMRHAKKFGAERKFRTWHEVVVLKEGEGRFEYFNCEGGTGVIGRAEVVK